MEYRLKINNDYLAEIEHFDGVTGNKNVYFCKFDITCDEAEALWFAVFKKGNEAYVTAISGNGCKIPYECLETKGTVYLGCYAECANEKRISTNWIPLNIEEGAYTDGTAPEPPSDDLWETLLANSVPVIGENGNWFTYDIIGQEYADTGFAARGEQGVQGVKGDKGDKGDTGASGHWKLLGNSEISSGTSDAIAVNVSENAFFTNTDYTKFKLVFDLVTVSSYTSTTLPLRIWFRKDVSADYRLFANMGNALYRPSNDAVFHGEFMIYRNSHDPNVVSSILMPTQNGGGADAISVQGAGNNGVFASGITAANLKNICLNIVNSNLAAGTKAWFYAWEE